MPFKMIKFPTLNKVEQKFFVILFSLCLAYLIYELIYIPYWALSADEFVFARHIYEYTYHLPYRDFPPYKTILGYYVLSLPLWFSQHILAPLFYIKTEIALLNTLALGLTCYWGTQFFSRSALLITALAILANQTFLLYGTDLRVDMLTCWFCLFAALAILDKRFMLAGLCMATAFLISQKALWTYVAINGGLALCFCLFTSGIYTWRALVKFNTATALPILGYIVFWSLLSDQQTVLHNLFYEAYIQAGIDWYTPIYLTCWLVVLNHGPMLFFLWPLTFISLSKEYNHSETIQRRLFILISSSIALLLFVSYKQAFPYNFVFTIPALFLLYADFFTWFLRNDHVVIQNKFVVWFYAGLLFSIVYLADLSAWYYLAIFIPLLLSSVAQANFKRQIILCIFVLTGIILPFISSFNISRHADGRYQQTMLQLTADLLQDGSSYVGGIPYLYNRDQSIDGMQNLIGPALEYLYQPTPKLATLLLPSLYLAPTNQQEILQAFEKKPVKVIIDNYRIKYLPSSILNYINNNYQQYNGSVYLYAPLITSSQLSFRLKFSGTYQITANKKQAIRLDGKIKQPGILVNLRAGDHITDAQQDYRLVYMPTMPANSYPKYTKDAWLNMIKAIIS